MEEPSVEPTVLTSAPRRLLLPPPHLRWLRLGILIAVIAGVSAAAWFLGIRDLLTPGEEFPREPTLADLQRWNPKFIIRASNGDGVTSVVVETSGQGTYFILPSPNAREQSGTFTADLETMRRVGEFWLVNGFYRFPAGTLSADGAQMQMLLSVGPSTHMISCKEVCPAEVERMLEELLKAAGEDIEQLFRTIRA